MLNKKERKELRASYQRMFVGEKGQSIVPNCLQGTEDKVIVFEDPNAPVGMTGKEVLAFLAKNLPDWMTAPEGIKE